MTAVKPTKTKATATEGKYKSSITNEELFDMLEKEVADVDPKELRKLEEAAERHWLKPPQKRRKRRDEAGQEDGQEIRALPTPDNRHPGSSQEGRRKVRRDRDSRLRNKEARPREQCSCRFARI